MTLQYGRRRHQQSPSSLPSRVTSTHATPTPGNHNGGSGLRQPSRTLQQLRSLTDDALKAKAVANATNGVGEAERARAATRVRELTDAVDSALDKAGRNARLKQRRVAPADRITDAAEDLGLAIQAIAYARAAGQFNVDDVEESLTTLRGAIERLAQLLHPGKSDQLGDSTSWLLAAAIADN